ncbi:MAG TPA: FHA domain-containing protein [Propionibacteriaceae bacterium]|nr:FHA domain-containing protein [Propionibacteriaceae bacterium]
MLVCRACGHSNPDSSNFCSNCGERLVATGSDNTRVIAAVTEDTGHQPELSQEEIEAVHSLPKGHALLIVERGPDAGARYLLDTDLVTVGRHPQSDIFLDDITVSRHHVNFRRTPEGMIVEDQNSLNGTYVNRTLVDGSALLRPGDEVQIGKYRMVYFVSEHGLS